MTGQVMLRKLAKALFEYFPQRLHMRGLLLELLDHCNVLPGQTPTAGCT